MWSTNGRSRACSTALASPSLWLSIANRHVHVQLVAETTLGTLKAKFTVNVNLHRG